MLSAIATDSDNTVKRDSLCKVRAPNTILHTEQDTTQFLLFHGNSIESDNEFFTMTCRPTDYKCCQLEHLKQQLMRITGQLMEVGITCLFGYDTYFTQKLTSTETSLCRTERQDVTYVKAAPRGPPLQLPLFLHKGVVLSPAGFNFALSGPTVLQKPIQEICKQLERSDVNPTNHNCRAEAAQILLLISKQRSTEHSSQILRESDGHHDQNRSLSTGYQLFPKQPLHECQRENHSHRLQGTAND